MKKISQILGVLAILVLGAGQAQAGLIGTITHDYGSGGHIPGGLSAGTCDTLNASSITVRNTGGCQRFYDAFDFSHLAYDAIDSFTLSVTFSDAGNGNFMSMFTNYEQWRVRPASSPVSASNVGTTFLDSSVNMTRSNSLTTNTYSFNASLDIFNDILAGEAFYLWFNHAGVGEQAFNLYSASLDVFGTARTAPVPVPGILSLFGLGLFGIALNRRRRSHT